jgi:hypothetical protein
MPEGDRVGTDVTRAAAFLSCERGAIEKGGFVALKLDEARKTHSAAIAVAGKTAETTGCKTQAVFLRR